MRKYKKCPRCGNTTIGNGQGRIIVEWDIWKDLRVDEDENEVK